MFYTIIVSWLLELCLYDDGEASHGLACTMLTHPPPTFKKNHSKFLSRVTKD